MEGRGFELNAILLTHKNDLIYETRPRYAFGRFYVQALDRDSLAFLCPGDLVRNALKSGTATLRAQGDGLGWHYPYHLRRDDDGNVKGDIARLDLVATRHAGMLNLVAELEVTRDVVQNFIVKVTLDSHDLAGLGPDYMELSLL
jgi:hypothetical protein